MRELILIYIKLYNVQQQGISPRAEQERVRNRPRGGLEQYPTFARGSLSSTELTLQGRCLGMVCILTQHSQLSVLSSLGW